MYSKERKGLNTFSQGIIRCPDTEEVFYCPIPRKIAAGVCYL